MEATIFKFLNRERRTSVRSHDFPRTYRLQPVVVQLTTALAITFPFNLLFGIPLYYQLAVYLAGTTG